MSLVKNQDSMAFKNYFNAHKDELHREIDSLNKLSGLKEKLLTSLAVDIQQSLTAFNQAPTKFKDINDLEKYFDTRLPYPLERDLKKYMIFHWLWKHSQAPFELNFNPLKDLLESECDNYVDAAKDLLK